LIDQLTLNADEAEP